MDMIQNIFTQLQQIDYLLLLNILEPIIIAYITTFSIDKAIKSYSLHRDYRPKDISMVVMPPELINRFNSFNADKIAASKYKESILKYAEFMTKNFSPKDLINFYNNINSLEVYSNSLMRKIGIYRCDINIIYINDNIASNNAIFHELFHMSSSVFKENVIYSGFSQSKIDMGNKIGVGLNEGYTDLLTQRYFGKHNGKYRNPYAYEVEIARLVEEIVGKEKMESLYLNANLEGLIDELKKYMSEDEIMKFIYKMDFVTKYSGEKKIGLSRKKMINNSMQDISKFLIICYSKKTVQEPNISNEEFINKFAKFVLKLSFHPRIEGCIYEPITDQIIKSSFDELNGLRKNR